jgi:hypothetical protein
MSVNEPASVFLPPAWRVRAALAMLLVLIVVVYRPGIGGGYTFDDYPNIVDNGALHVTRLNWNDWIAAALSSPASALQRPLSMLTFAANDYFTGTDPRPMKWTNLAIHLINTLLVFALIRTILRSVPRDGVRARRVEWAAAYAAAAWALAPINFMGVLYIVQRMESLSHVFVFAGLWLYAVGRMRMREARGGWPAIGYGLVVCTALGLLCKESAVLLPLYALCLELCVFGFRDGSGRRDPRIYALFAIVLVLPTIVGSVWMLPRIADATAYSGRDFTLGDRLLTEPRVVLDYLRWTLWPRLNELGLNHDDYVISRGLWNPPSTLYAIGALAALLVFAWRIRSRYPIAALGLLWFFAAQTLTATVIPLELVFEHRNYFASLGLCLALTDALLLIPATGLTRRGGVLLASIFVLLGATITDLRARDWSDPYAFSSSEALKHPRSPRATYDLARTLIVMTGYRKDSPLIEAAERALDGALRTPHSTVLPDHAALIFAAHLGKPLRREWWGNLQTKLRARPVGPQEQSSLAAMTDCAVAKACAFAPADMLAVYDAAASHGPNPEVLSMRGNYVLNVIGDGDETLRLWRQAEALRPAEPQYHISLAKLLIALRHYDEARAEIAQLRKIGRLGQNEAAALELESRMRSNDGPATQPASGRSLQRAARP